MAADTRALRRAVQLVALLNLGYFGVEITVALTAGSVSLFADSIDFLEDAALNLLILIGLRWSPKQRARLGLLLAAILLVPSLATLAMAVHKLRQQLAPAPRSLTLAALGALCVNFTCAWLLARYRAHSGSLTKAAFLSARNDAYANVAILGAAALTAATHSAWPDLLVGLAIAIMNADAARDVWMAARNEQREAAP